MALVLLLSVLIGVIAGLRTMMAPAAISWAASLGWLNLAPTAVAFLGYRFAPRIVSGGLCGAAIGAASGSLITGAIGGVGGAVIGTLGGRAFRGWMATAFGSDRPAALIEDAIAIVGA